jgi:hypothetical protein
MTVVNEVQGDPGLYKFTDSDDIAGWNVYKDGQPEVYMNVPVEDTIGGVHQGYLYCAVPGNYSVVPYAQEENAEGAAALQIT